MVDCFAGWRSPWLVMKDIFVYPDLNFIVQTKDDLFWFVAVRYISMTLYAGQNHFQKVPSVTMMLTILDCVALSLKFLSGKV